MSGDLRVPRWAHPGWLCFLGLAIAELAALFVRIERVPPDRDWMLAARVVRSDFRATDAITAAPIWADPLVRLHLGDLISAKIAGRVSLAPFGRLWVLSIRGARAIEAPARAPDFAQQVGYVSVERFDFGPIPVVTDLVDAFPSASVDVTHEGRRAACAVRRTQGGPAFRGGLGFGPMPPRERFVCGPNDAMWVGTTVLEDLELSPRRCIFQHPQGREPVAVTFHDIHLGQVLVLHAGLDYHQERHERGANVTLRALVDGYEIGRMVHRDGEGMKRVEFATHPQGQSPTRVRGDLRLEVTTSDATGRAFCWAGSIRDAARRETP